VRPAKSRRDGEIFESFICGFNHARCGTGIVLGDELLDPSKLVFNARRKNEFRHSLPSCACGAGESLPRQ
jgi:hypothetical protein